MLTLRGHTILPGPLGPSSTIVDLGANRGEFAREARDRFRCRVIAVEANPRLISEIARIPGVKACHCAIAGQNGEAAFYLSEDTEAGALSNGITRPTGETVKVRTRTLASLLEEENIDRVDLLKVDIEGAEIELFDSMSDVDLDRFDQITLEFHDFCCLVTPGNVIRICRRLRLAGFDAMRFGGWDRRSDNLNWLFIRPGLAAAGPFRRAYVKHIIRPLRNALHRGRHRAGISGLCSAG
jgi:FkbM family methyltransferase